MALRTSSRRARMVLRDSRTFVSEATFLPSSFILRAAPSNVIFRTRTR